MPAGLDPGAASVSVLLALSEDDIENNTIRKKREDGKSTVDDWKEYQYENIWHPIIWASQGAERRTRCEG